MTLRNGSSVSNNSFTEPHQGTTNCISSVFPSEERPFFVQCAEYVEVGYEMLSKAHKMVSMFLFAAFCTFSSGLRFLRGEKKNFALFFGRFLGVFAAFFLLKWAFFGGNSSKVLHLQQQQQHEQQQLLLQRILSKQTELEGDFYKRINESLSAVQLLSDSVHQLKDQSETAIQTTKKDTSASIEQLKTELTGLVEGKVANLFLLINASKGTATSEQDNALSFDAVEKLVERVEQMESKVGQVLPALSLLQERLASISSSPSIEMEDFALVSRGASIVESLTSPTFEASSFFFGNTKGKQPVTALSPNNALGNCWSFAGSKGMFTVQLGESIFPSSFSIEHIHSQNAVNPSSAPREVKVYALRDAADESPILVGKHIFSLEAGSIQTFAASKTLQEPINLVQLKILSNNGHSKFTCLYKFRVHGKRAKK